MVMSPRKFVIAEYGDIEIALKQRMLLDGGELKVQTAFMYGGERERDVAKLDTSQEGVERVMDVVDRHWDEACNESADICETAERYLEIKTRDNATPELSAEVLRQAMDDFMTEMPVPQYVISEYARGEPGEEKDMYFPVTGFCDRMFCYRKVIADADVGGLEGALKLDDIEKLIMRGEKRLEKLRQTMREAIPEDDGLPPSVAEEHFADFRNAALDALDAANHAWWDAANWIHNGEPLAIDELEVHAAKMQKSLADAKQAFEAFKDESREINPAYDVDAMNEVVYSEKGLFPALEKLASVVGRDNLLQSAIEKGLAPQRSKQ